MGLLRSFQPMEYSSTGTVSFSGDPAGDWLITAKTSGSVTFTKLSVPVDIFMLGGGAGVPENIANGAGSGKTTTKRKVRLKRNQKYTFTIGAGGEKTNGGSTTFEGGDISYKITGGTKPNEAKGGNGGSGGGAYAWVQNSGANTKGGSNGSSGYSSGEAGSRTPGTGQGSTTRDFGEASGTLRAGAGAGCWGQGASAIFKSAAGGSGGGGKSGYDGSANSQGGPNQAGANGTINYGGGGGADGTTGGSGILLIRNHRE